MKRLLGLTGLTCLCVLTACFYLKDTVMLIAGAFTFLLFVISMFVPSVRRESTLPVAFATVVLSVLLFFGFTHFYVQPIQDTYEGKTCTVTAVQRNEVYKSNGYYCYELDVNTIDDKKVNTGMILFTQEHIFSDPYDELTFEALLRCDTYGGDLSKGLYLRSYLLYDDAKVQVATPDKKPLMYYIINLRNELRTSLYMEMSPDTAGFSSAVLLGDKHALDNDVKNLLRICGLSHISVVSGLHLSIIATVSIKVSRYLLRNKYLSVGFTILSIIAFTLLSGCGIPVIRSAIMLIIYTIGTLLPRRSDSLNSIGAAALIILLPNPYAVGDIGMLLSFSATIGIVAWSDKLTKPIMSRLCNLSLMKFKFVRNIIKTLVYTFVCSICASLWTMPVSILVFGGFSAVAVVANLLTVPILTYFIIFIIICAVTHYISFLPLISQVFAFAVSLYYDYLIFVCNLLSKIPYAYIDTDKSYFYFWLSATLILIAIAVIIGTKYAYRITVIASIMILLWSSVAYNINRESVVTLHIPDTGSALSVVLESTDGHAVLCCGGSKWSSFALKDTVESISAGNKNILVSTSEENSVQYAENLMNEFDYEQVLLYDNKSTYIITDDNYEATEVSIYNTDQSIYLWDKVQVELLPVDSVVYEYITAGDTQILILPEYADCEQLDSIYRTPDIIITHGVVDNMGLLSCDTLIVSGDDYIARATAELCAPVADRVITGTDIVYDIKLK